MGERVECGSLCALVYVINKMDLAVDKMGMRTTNSVN